jgi:dienelactone hydrolase
MPEATAGYGAAPSVAMRWFAVGCAVLVVVPMWWMLTHGAHPATGASIGTDVGAESHDMLEVPTFQDRRPLIVDTWTLDLVDVGRPTRPVAWDAPTLPWRSLPTAVRAPRTSGPSPLVVFSHGLGSSPEHFSQLLDTWAAAGYVVVAPRFPLTSDANPDHDLEVSDQHNHPGDVSFVLDEVLAAAATPGDRLFGRVNPGAIGAAGFSLGGGATYALAYNDCCRDDRIDAVTILGSAVLIHTGVTDLTRRLPVLIVHSTTDEALSYSFARDAFAQVGGPSWFVTLRAVAHHDAFDNSPTALDVTVEMATTAFWDRTLRNVDGEGKFGDADTAAAADAEAAMRLAVIAARGAADLDVGKP